MIKPCEVITELKSISDRINRIAKITGYAEFGDLSELDIDRTIPNDIFLERELRVVLEALGDIQGNIDYLALPVKYQSTLFRNADGRYETQQGDYYTAGSIIEYLSHDERRCEYPFWRKSRVEYGEVDYRIPSEPELPLSDLTVRVRRHCK